jgi:hypothetical protein
VWLDLHVGPHIKSGATNFLENGYTEEQDGLGESFSLEKKGTRRLTEVTKQWNIEE